MNRRFFLRVAGATSVAGLSAPAKAGSAETRATVAVVYDVRIERSRRFADVLSQCGAVALATGAEGLESWQEAHRGGWRRIVGLTTHSDFLVWGEAARRAGLRLTFETLHDGRDGAEGYPGTLISWIFG